ncbi:hypothetical protein [Rhizorhabdus argentea]|uniref:hypothetical protein n=1 Tax=Rhizorhabdus argentea TaxID=1387174 RepID=UPI0030EEFD9C
MGRSWAITSGNARQSTPRVEAKKLRYYDDRNFTARVLPPLLLAQGGFADRPRPRPDDCSGLAPIAVTAAGSGGGEAVDEGGLYRAPELGELADRPSLVPADIPLLDDEAGEDDMTGAALSRAARRAALDPDDGIAL